MILRANSDYNNNCCWSLNKPVSRSGNDDCSFSGFTIISEHHRGYIFSACWSFDQ